MGEVIEMWKPVEDDFEDFFDRFVLYNYTDMNEDLMEK
jgi:hypothetical protein